jgi:predicted amidohydrolase YtcJ
VGQGTFGQPLPTRSRLDEVAPHNPVVIRQSMHFQVANSAALQAAGIDRSYVPRNGIRVGRTDTGEATGEVEEGFDLFPIPYPPLDWYLTALPAQTLESWVRHGVTTVHELPATPTAIAAWQRLDAAARMPCRITLNPILAPGHQATVHAIDDYLRLGMQTGFGSEWLKFGAVKLFLDGAGRAAWSRDQLTRSPGAWGLPCFSFNELVAILTACRRSGVQVWMHAVGDVAQWLAIDAVEAVNRVLGRDDHRTRVEHIGNDGSDLAQLPRLVEAGIVPVPTAAFMYGNMTGPEDDGLVAVERRAYPYRTLLEHGLHTPGNSDTAGTQPFATNPWYGVRCMVARRNKDGAAVAPAEEAIDVAAAVRTYTRDGAYVAFEERVKGSVEIGKLGDLGVYPEDPLEMSPEDLPSIVTDLTLVGGRVVHGDG